MNEAYEKGFFLVPFDVANDASCHAAQGMALIGLFLDSYAVKGFSSLLRNSYANRGFLNSCA